VASGPKGRRDLRPPPLGVLMNIPPDIEGFKRFYFITQLFRGIEPNNRAVILCKRGEYKGIWYQGSDLRKIDFPQENNRQDQAKYDHH
jgi:hypothetical protein